MTHQFKGFNLSEQGLNPQRSLHAVKVANLNNIKPIWIPPSLLQPQPIYLLFCIAAHLQEGGLLQQAKELWEIIPDLFVHGSHQTDLSHRSGSVRTVAVRSLHLIEEKEICWNIQDMTDRTFFIFLLRIQEKSAIHSSNAAEIFPAKTNYYSTYFPFNREKKFFLPLFLSIYHKTDL